MIKNIAFISATVAMLVLSGCSSKEPAIDATANTSASSTTTSASTGADSARGSGAAVIDSISNGSSQDSVSADASSSVATIYFDYDKYNIREDMQSAMSSNIKLVNGKVIKLEGNCDEFGSDEYNYALGLKRATTVKNALVEGGVDAASISMVSYGESNPVCLEKTQECWAKNRRVDFKLQ